MKFTRREANEIYYALESKRVGLVRGLFGHDDDGFTPENEPITNWIKDIDAIMKKIGEDGENLTK